MKRFGVFIFFDPEGVVDRYVTYLLDEISRHLSDLAIVVNGLLDENGRGVLSTYSDKIFIRDNIGFDGGAYKDFFCNYGHDINLLEFDEVILFNDSFFGPLFHFSEVFEIMDQTDASFWGLSRHPGGFFGEIPFSPHIQAYFIDIRKDMFSNPEFNSFWDEQTYSKDHVEAVSGFEIRFSEYFSGLGYEYTTWLDQVGYTPEPFENVCCSENMEDLIVFHHFPIIKKKIMTLSNYKMIENIYNYIDCSTDYPIEYLHENMIRQHMLDNTGGYPSFFSLWKFYEDHQRVFIYGAGKVSRMFVDYFNYHKWKISGIIVTYKDSKKPGIIALGEVDFREGDGVVLAVSKKYQKEIVPQIEGVADYYIL